MTQRALILFVFAVGLSGCAGSVPFFGALFQRAISTPGGVNASRSSNPNVHCQTGPDGRTDCVEYRTSAPLRNGDPAPLGADPYASTGASANASAAPATSPLFAPLSVQGAPASSSASTRGAPTEAVPATAPTSWQAPLASAPQPLPPPTPHGGG